MKILVTDDFGDDCFSYDTNGNSHRLHPNMGATPKVVEALREALRFIAPPTKHILADAGR